jgi:glycosyltransferase involved in cell wall biosynthesis
MICVWVHKRSWRDPGPVVNVGVRNAHSFAMLGYETHLVVGHGEPSDTDEDLRDFYGITPRPELHIHRVARRRLLGSNSSVPIFWHASRLIRQLARRDTVLAFAREPSFLPYLAWLGRNPRIHTFFEAHNFFADLSWRNDPVNAQDRRQGWLERRCVPHLSGVAAIVAPQADLYAKRFPQTPAHAFPLGTEPMGLGDPEARRRERRAVYVGHMHSAKGVKTLLEAVTPEEGALRAAFWGGGEAQMEKHRARMQAKGIDRVEFIAFRPPEQLQHDLATRASVGVVALHDTYYNANLTCPVKALDYLSHGLPIIASDLPSNRSVLGDAALYVPPADTAALRHSLLSLLDDPAEYLRRSKLSWQRALELAWPERAQRLVDWARQSSAILSAFLGPLLWQLVTWMTDLADLADVIDLPDV